jgi:hypothetical protein
MTPIPRDAKIFSRGAPPRLSYSPGEALANTGTRLMIDRMKIFAIRLDNGNTPIVSGETSEEALRNAGFTTPAQRQRPFESQSNHG